MLVCTQHAKHLLRRSVLAVVCMSIYLLALFVSPLENNKNNVNVLQC